MRVTVDTAHDSHEDIRKVIKMLQHLVGDSQEVFTNQPQSSETQTSPIANIFGDTASAPATSSEETAQAASQAEETLTSTEDLFAELFSEEELKKMDVKKESEEEEESEEEIKSKAKDKKYGIEFY